MPLETETTFILQTNYKLDQNVAITQFHSYISMLLSAHLLLLIHLSLFDHYVP